MVISSFGKTCEGKRKGVRVKITRSEDEFLQWTNQPEFQAFKIRGENFASISLHQSELLWDKPTIVGACILDLAKKFVFYFLYNTMKRNFTVNSYIQTLISLCMKSDQEPFLLSCKERKV